ncbi:hypothetical protein KS4_03240 [Poriferisphaera corsica]|uniref:SGNH/GDSL hydrolase family protein n=1 Tax=Poriferisphaera corsica TaxID=2528020 RepID=A0A517YPZ9_9BACT|nr:hypothetical protein [Poriferisphaera corsica]QDU32293.1 hypothetical protein KS4_03240 [Poriferisphaera corsica]
MTSIRHRHIALLATCFSLVCAFTSTPITANITSYHIGNSLTWNSNPDISFAQTATQLGLQWDTGYHIRCGSSLEYIQKEPDITCVPANPDFGFYTEALPNHQWDYVTFQPYSDWGSTFQTDINAFNHFRDLTHTNPANANTTFLIYAAWPQKTTDFATDWLRPASTNPSQNTILSREYFDNLATTLREQNPSLTVNVIPIGEVLNNINNEILNNNITILSQSTSNPITRIDDIYKDDKHLGDIGSYIASMTTLATILKQPPPNLDAIPTYFTNDSPQKLQTLTPELAAQLNDIIWDTVSTHAFTAVPEPASLTFLLLPATLLTIRRRPAKH